MEADSRRNIDAQTNLENQLTGSTGSSSSVYSLNPPGQCRRMCYNYTQGSCVPWFTYKYRKYHATYNDQKLIVKSIDSLKHESTWYKLETHGQTPLSRIQHAAVTVGYRMFLVGGRSPKGLLNDVQELHLESSEWREWNLWTPESGPHCYGHNLFLWGTKLLLVGGRIEPMNQLMEVHAFELETRKWRRLGISGEIPVYICHFFMARVGQSIVQVGSVLVMFGGEDARGQLRNDIQILNLKTFTWFPSSTVGTKPCPRKEHSAACYGSRYLWIFGGKSRSSYLNDVHCLDLRTMEWVATEARGNVVPRAGHASVIVGHKLYIVGGEYNKKEIIGTLVFDLPTQRWSVVTTVAPGSPLANDGLSIVNVRHKGRNYLVTYGGHGFHLSNDVYVMMLPQFFQLRNGFQIERPSRLRVLLRRLTGGKPPRRKIRHPERHASQASLISHNMDAQPENELSQMDDSPSQAHLHSPSEAPSRTSTASDTSVHEKMIEVLLKDKQEMEQKLNTALKQIDKLQQGMLNLQRTKHTDKENKCGDNDAIVPEEKLIPVVNINASSNE